MCLGNGPDGSAPDSIPTESAVVGGWDFKGFPSHLNHLIYQVSINLLIGSARFGLFIDPTIAKRLQLGVGAVTLSIAWRQEEGKLSNTESEQRMDKNCLLLGY